jgi:hypothetical protein
MVEAAFPELNSQGMKSLISVRMRTRTSMPTPAHAHYQEDRWRKVTNRAKKAAEKDHQESRAYQQLGSKADDNGLE